LTSSIHAGEPPEIFFKAETFNGSVGLTSALLVLPSCEIVMVGNVPVNTGLDIGSAQAGSLMFIDGHTGRLLLEFTDPLINGPWGATTDDRGRTMDREGRDLGSESSEHVHIFISNVLDGTIARLKLECKFHERNPIAPFIEISRVAQGLSFGTNPKSILVGPTGLLLVQSEHDRDRDCEDEGRDRDDERWSCWSRHRESRLLIADTFNNRILRMDDSKDRLTVEDFSAPVAHQILLSGAPLNGPLALAPFIFREGDHLSHKFVIVSNGDSVIPTSNPLNPLPNLAVVFNMFTGEIKSWRPLARPPFGANFGMTTTQDVFRMSLDGDRSDRSIASCISKQLIHIDVNDNTVRVWEMPDLDGSLV
jgi:hypothetical protein